MKKQKKDMTELLWLPNHEISWKLSETVNYKYLGKLETDILKKMNLK